MNGKYRWAYIREGMDGIRRLLDEEEQRDMNRRLHMAKRRGLVAESRIGKRLDTALTENGLESLARTALRAAGPRQDGKRVYVMYDIPEKFRASRDRLRSILKRAGFSRYQQSVWRTDRDVEALLKAWLQRHKLEKWVDISIL
jgi:DNA-binding transcriptional regulator PaaX